MAKILWKDLFDFSNNADITSAIEQIKLLDKEYSRFAANIKTQSAHIDKALSDLKTDTAGLAESTKKLSEAQLKNADTVKKSVDATAAAVKQAKALKTAKENAIRLEKEQGRSVDALTARLKVQILEFKKIDVSTKAGAAAAEKLGKANRALKQEIKGMTDIMSRQNNAFERAEDSYNGLVAKNAKLRQELKNLPGAFSKNSAEVEKFRQKSKALEGQIAANSSKLKEFDKRIGDNFRNVGNYKSAVAGAGAELKRFAVQLTAATLGLQALFQASKQGFQSFVDFEFTMTSVKALSGATGKEFEKLEAQALELGSTTSNTAGDVAQLQLELTKLGFNPQQINESTEAINQLSIAFDTDLGEAAILVAGTLNGFNLSAEESTRVADVFAKAAATSALDMTKIGVAMAAVAPAADAVNISLEATTAIVGKLADQNIDASTAGTGLRNVLLELSSSNSKLSKALGTTVNSQEDFFDALENLADQGIDTAEALIESGEATGALGLVAELTGKRTAIALLSIVKNREAIEEQTKALEESTGFLDKYSAIMKGTTKIALDEVTSAAEGFAITLFRELKPAINAILAVLVALFGALSAGVKIIKENKELFLALGAAILTVQTRTVAAKLATINLNVAQKASAIFTGKLTKAWKVLNATMKANPIGLVVAGILALVSALKFAERFTTRFKEVQEGQNEILEQTAAELDVVNTANEELAKQTENIANLTEDEKTAIVDRNKAMRESLLLRVEELRAQNLVLASQAAELTMLQKLKKAALGAVAPAAAIGVAAADSAKNVGEATEETNQQIDELERALAELDLSLAQFEDARDNEHENALARIKERTEKELAAYAKLRIFRLEQEAKALRERLKFEGLAVDQIEDLNNQLKDKLIAIEEIKRDELLKQEGLTASGRLLIIEQHAAAVAEIEGKAIAAVNKAMIDEFIAMQSAIEQQLADLESEFGITGRVSTEGDFDMPDEEIEDLTGEQNDARQKLFQADQRRASLKFKQLEELRANDEISEAEYQKRLLDLSSQSRKDIIAGLQSIYGSSTEINDLITEDLKIENDKRKENAAKTWKAIGDFAMQAFTVATDLASQAADREVQDSEFRLERLEAERQRDVELAGDNAEQIKIINDAAAEDRRRLEAERRAALTKQAKIEKAVALVSAVVNTARGVAAALPLIPLAILVGALGAVQIATIAAQPIPQFATGTKSSPAGLAVVGEQGDELIVSPSGKMEVATGGAQLKNLEKGSQVFTRDETAEIARTALTDGGSYNRNETAIINNDTGATKQLIKEVKSGNKALQKSIADMERFSFEGTRRGLEAFRSKQGNRVEILNERYG